MDPQRRSIYEREIGPLLANLAKLAGAFCVIAFFWDGPDTRAWMLAFFGGATSSLLGASQNSAQADGASNAPLKLLGHHCKREYDYQICEGEVRNETSEGLEDVMGRMYPDAFRRPDDVASEFVRHRYVGDDDVMTLGVVDPNRIVVIECGDRMQTRKSI